MDQNFQMNQSVETLFTNLESFTQNEGVMGKPVTYGDKTFIPVVSVTIGYGSGNTASKNQMGSGATGQAAGMGTSNTNIGGGALGLGAKLTTEAIVVIDKDTVSMLPLTTTASAASQLVDKIPQMFMNMNQNKQGGQQQGQGQQNQDQQNQWQQGQQQ